LPALFPSEAPRLSTRKSRATAAVLAVTGTASGAVSFVPPINAIGETHMRKTLTLLIVAGALVSPVAIGLGACNTTTEEKAGAGAVGGAVVGGPVGAAVGGAAGAVAGHVQDDTSKPHN
jgi:hypothetical protein